MLRISNLDRVERADGGRRPIRDWSSWHAQHRSDGLGQGNVKVLDEKGVKMLKIINRS
jgi:hypothetical protein